MKGTCSKCGKILVIPKGGLAPADHPCGAPIIVSMKATATGESKVN
jgi:hypothetical protein